MTNVFNCLTAPGVHILKVGILTQPEVNTEIVGLLQNFKCLILHIDSSN